MPQTITCPKCGCLKLDINNPKPRLFHPNVHFSYVCKGCGHEWIPETKTVGAHTWVKPEK